MRYDFTAHLAKYGPDGRPAVPISLGRARRYCEQLARSHYENFSVMSPLLPRPLRKHFPAVYAYCRWADDLGDETGGGAKTLDLLRWWREQLHDCYRGQVWHPVFVALRATIDEFAIPQQPFLDLLWAFEQDQLVTRYATFADLLDYCRHSANPVGRIVLHLFRASEDINDGLSDSICTGLQLANFWQDVARDRAIGRVYLPEEDRRRFGYRDADFNQARYTASFVQLMQFEVERAKDMLYRGLPLTRRVPREARGSIELFVAGGLAICRRIERLHYNVWTDRPKLGIWDKCALIAAALGRRLNRSLGRDVTLR